MESSPPLPAAGSPAIPPRLSAAITVPRDWRNWAHRMAWQWRRTDRFLSWTKRSAAFAASDPTGSSLPSQELEFLAHRQEHPAAITVLQRLRTSPIHAVLPLAWTAASISAIAAPIVYDGSRQTALSGPSPAPVLPVLQETAGSPPKRN